MMLWHVRNQLPNVLLASLCPQNEQIKLISLQLHDNLGDCSLEVQAGHQLTIVSLRELLLTEFNADDWLKFVLDFCVWENDIAIDNAELHSVELFDAKGLTLQGLVEAINLFFIRHSIQLFDFDVLSK